MTYQSTRVEKRIHAGMSDQRQANNARRSMHARSPRWRAACLTLRADVFLVITLLVTALLAACSSVKQPQIATHCEVSRFVSAAGSTLCVNGQLLRLIGYNWNWTGAGCQTPTDAEIEQTFSRITQASKANVVRTAFYQSGSDGGVYSNFDRYIAAAKRHHLYILPILANQWTDCEPSSAAKTAAWYHSGYRQAGDGYPLSYRDYVRHLAAHYANEPTIAFWQLINEPDIAGAPCGATAAQTLRAFADDMVALIRSVDPHHLVDLGAPGNCAGDTPDDYREIVASSVAVADVWHDYNQAPTPAPSMLRQRMQALQALQKPAFVGEAGICADVDPAGACGGAISSASLTRRAVYFDAKLAAGFDLGLSGYIIWNTGSQSVQFDIGPTDPAEAVLAGYALTQGQLGAGT